MTIQHLLNDLQRRGITLEVNGNDLDICGRGQKEKQLEPGIIERLREHKADIIKELGQASNPYFDATGDLVIPFKSDPRFHWWAGGMTISQIREWIAAQNN